jgi:hypothetical protein
MFTNTIVLIVLNGIFIKNTGFLEITGTQKMFVTYFYLFYLGPYRDWTLGIRIYCDFL